MKKSVRKLLTVLLLAVFAAAAMLPAAPAVQAAYTYYTSGDYTYYLNSGEAHISGYSGSASTLSIPGTLDGYPVYSLEDNAFKGCTTLTGVTIPASVSWMASNAFAKCTSLRSITVASGNSLYCSVDGVVFNKNMTRLVIYPINRAGTSYSVPSGVTEIGTQAFLDAKNLTSVTLPSTVTVIGISAFSQCAALTSVTIPNSVNTIKSSAFSYCEALKSVTLPSGLTSLQANAFYRCTSLKSVSIPSGVKSLESGAFSESGVSSVTLPEGLTSIGFSFRACQSLTEITIPKSVTEIHTNAFSDSALKTIRGYSGSAAEAYAKEKGFAFVALSDSKPKAPVISAVTGTADGIKVTFSSVSNAAKYYVYRKGPGESGFSKIAGVLGTTCTDKTAVSGKEYRYSVRAVSSTGVLSDFSAGKSLLYLKTPTISVANDLNGVKISWAKIPGASKYYIYRKGPGESGFSLLSSTTALSYVNKGVTSGKEYRYTVRAVPSSGSMSGYAAGKTILYLKAPAITAANTSAGVKISWAKITGASKYYVYRKGPGESGFTKLAGAVGTTLTDKTAVSGKEYRYSVRSVNSDATVLSAYSAGQSITYRK